MAEGRLHRHRFAAEHLAGGQHHHLTLPVPGGLDAAEVVVGGGQQRAAPAALDGGLGQADRGAEAGAPAGVLRGRRILGEKFGGR